MLFRQNRVRHGQLKYLKGKLLDAKIQIRQLPSIVKKTVVYVTILFVAVFALCFISIKQSNNKIRKKTDADMVIIYWTKISNDKPSQSWARCLIPNEIITCSMPNNSTKRILITDDHASAEEADAFIFHGIDTSPKHLRSKQQNDILIHHSSESPVNYPFPLVSNEGMMNKFDLSMSYKFDSDIFIPYLNVTSLKKLYEDEPHYSFEQKTKLTGNSLVAWVGSNCHAQNGREIYLKKLFGKIGADSFGKCLNNKPFPAEYKELGKYESLVAVASKYKFYVAVENSNCEDYITEKLRNSIFATSVPIVFSVDNVPNYSDFMPPHSFINIADFESTDALAKYLKKVGTDKDLYDAYFWYKGANITNSKLSVQWKETQKRFKRACSTNVEIVCEIANAVFTYKASGVRKKLKSDQSCLEKNIMTHFM